MIYHLSMVEGLKQLIPKIPECAIEKYEDKQIKRICFSDSIDGCLSSLQQPGLYYVYIPHPQLYIVHKYMNEPQWQVVNSIQHIIS